MGKGFTNASIDWILSNPKYKGVYEFNNRRKKGRFNYYEQEVVRVDMPELAIVPPNLWQKVQKLPGVRKEAKLTYLLRGKIVCGNCGYSMSGSSYGGEKNYGGAYSCWNCRKRENKILRIGRDKTETYVLDFLKSQIKEIDPAGITELVNRKIDTQAQKGRSSKLAEDLVQIETSIRKSAEFCPAIERFQRRGIFSRPDMKSETRAILWAVSPEPKKAPGKPGAYDYLTRDFACFMASKKFLVKKPSELESAKSFTSNSPASGR